MPPARPFNDVHVRERPIVLVQAQIRYDVIVDALALQFRDVVVYERLGVWRERFGKVQNTHVKIQG
jgi:hypothetical protein